jgi:hypothetical protein
LKSNIFLKIKAILTNSTERVEGEGEGEGNMTKVIHSMYENRIMKPVKKGGVERVIDLVKAHDMSVWKYCNEFFFYNQEILI